MKRLMRVRTSRVRSQFFDDRKRKAIVASDSNVASGHVAKGARDLTKSANSNEYLGV
jgi:hypothetical protein